jgi:hypothetical protein
VVFELTTGEVTTTTPTNGGGISTRQFSILGRINIRGMRGPQFSF